MAGRNSQVARIYKLLNIIEGAPHGLTASELQSRLEDRGFEVKIRTVYRDLDALKEAGFPLIARGTNTDNGTRWTLEKTAKINHYLILSPGELVALYLARGMLSPLQETPFFNDLNTVFQKIDDKIPSKSHDHLKEVADEIHFAPGPKWGLGLNPEIIDTVRAACTEKQKIRGTYSSVNSGKTSERVLGPHFLYFSKGSLYLVAEDLGDGKNKIFSLPRFKDIEMLDEVYEGEEVDPNNYFDSSLGIYHSGDPVTVVIKVSPPLSSFVRERRWHSTQKVVAKENGCIELHLEVGITPELVQWILGFGSAAKVIMPEELKVKVRDAAKATLEAYNEDIKEAG